MNAIMAYSMYARGDNMASRAYLFQEDGSVIRECYPAHDCTPIRQRICAEQAVREIAYLSRCMREGRDNVA